jgi:hypothetical protein
MNFKELHEGAEPKMPGAPKGISIMTPQQFVASAGDMPDEEGVAEGWKDEANDYKEWSNHVKDELLSVSPSQRYSMAQRLSQIEHKHFGSNIQTGFDAQTGRPDSTSDKSLTGTVSQIYRAIKDGSLGSSQPAGTQQTAFGTITRPANAPDPYHASPASASGDRLAALAQLKGDSRYGAATTPTQGSGAINILRTEEDWEEALNDPNRGRDLDADDGPMSATGFSSAMSKLPSWKVMLATIMLASKLPIIGDKVKNTIISSIKNEFGVQMSFKEALGYMQHVRTTPPEQIVSPAVWKFERDGGDYETAIEQLPDDEVNVSPAQVMSTIANDLISAGVAKEIKPEKEEKPMAESESNISNYTPRVGDEVLWRSSDPKSKMMPMPGTVLAIAPGKVKLKIYSKRMIQNSGKDTVVLDLNRYTIMPKQSVTESVDYKADAEKLKKQGNMIGYHKTMVRYYDALANNASNRADEKRYEALANKHHMASKGVAEGQEHLDRIRKLSGLGEATKLPAQTRDLKGQEFQDYMTRIVGTPDLDKAGNVKVDKKGNEKYTTGKTKGDKYKMPYIHRSSVVTYLSPDGKTYDEDAVKQTLAIRPKALLKQNEKMKHSNGEFEQFFNVGFAALVGIALDEQTNNLIVVNTCPGAGSCKVDCFAMKGGKIQFKAAWQSDGRILTYLLNDPDGFFNQLSNEISVESQEGAAGDKKFPNGWKVTVRWHDAGDFFSPEYLDMALKMAAKHPDVRFYAYTKMAGAALAKKPDNFIINWSEGANTEQEKQVKAQDPKLDKTKNSRIVPEKLFYDLLAKDEKGNLKKTDDGAWQPADDAALKQMKQRIANEYGISSSSILSYNEYMSKRNSIPAGMKYNVIVAPGEGDVSANDPGVLSTLLLRH